VSGETYDPMSLYNACYGYGRNGAALEVLCPDCRCTRGSGLRRLDAGHRSFLGTETDHEVSDITVRQLVAGNAAKRGESLFPSVF
jgi:hypothetical protein